MKKIVITGTHGVGKTTLVEKLATSLRTKLKVGVIPETARALVAQGIPMNDEVSEFGIACYIVTYLKAQRELPTDLDLAISDRSLFDLFVYITDKRPEKVRYEFVQLVEELVFEEMKNVELFVYIPIEFEMESDGVRPFDLDYQKRIDSKVKTQLETFGARTITSSGDLDNRVREIEKYLNV